MGTRERNRYDPASFSRNTTSDFLEEREWGCLWRDQRVCLFGLPDLTPMFSHRASKQDDQVQRFIDVVRYYLSGWHIKPKVKKKNANGITLSIRSSN
jgi:hypothetical protein